MWVTQIVDNNNTQLQTLLIELDAELRIRDGEDHAFYAQYNKVDTINHLLLVTHNNKPIGCGALKHYAAGVTEIKRMYTVPVYRGKGVASTILNELEVWAKKLRYNKCILETGINQPEAIGLYKKCNYSIIANYGQYTNMEASVCFQKII
jgi:putative acetyltransferase